MPFLLGAAALLLVATGAAKLRRPEPTRAALFAVGLPTWLALPVGAAEVVAGVAALVWHGPVAPIALAMLYAGFAAYVAVALAKGSTASCGCSGSDDTPPTRLHVVVDLGAAAVGVVAAVAGTQTVVGSFGSVRDALLTVAFTPLVAWSGWLLITLLPRLVATRRALHVSVRT